MRTITMSEVRKEIRHKDWLMLRASIMAWCSLFRRTEATSSIFAALTLPVLASTLT